MIYSIFPTSNLYKVRTFLHLFKNTTYKYILLIILIFVNIFNLYFVIFISTKKFQISYSTNLELSYIFSVDPLTTNLGSKEYLTNSFFLSIMSNNASADNFPNLSFGCSIVVNPPSIKFAII